MLATKCNKVGQVARLLRTTSLPSVRTASAERTMALYQPSNSPWDRWMRSRINQHMDDFESETQRLMSAMIPREFRSMFRFPSAYWKPFNFVEAAKEDAGARVDYGRDKFQAHLDVQQFKPEEISVKLTGDDTIEVEGKHEEKQDNEGYISRHFVRRFVLPKGHNLDKIESKLSPDGILSITVPNTAAAEDVRTIPITREEKKAIEGEKQKDEKN